jgi:putative tricarboxylic transport membrane protein
MRPLNPGEKLFGYLMLCFSLFLLYQTYKIAGFSSISSGGAYPMAAAALMVVSSVVVVLRNRRMPKVEAAGPGEEWSRFRKEVAPPYPLLGYIGIMILYMVLIEPLGFNLSSFLFLFGSFLYLYRRGIWLTLGLSLGSVIIIYIVFQLVFQVILPEGEWLSPIFARLGV